MKRLGLISINEETDLSLLQEIVGFMIDSKISYEGFFYDWYGGIQRDNDAMLSSRKVYYN